MLDTEISIDEIRVKKYTIFPLLFLKHFFEASFFKTRVNLYRKRYGIRYLRVFETVLTNCTDLTSADQTLHSFLVKISIIQTRTNLLME